MSSSQKEVPTVYPLSAKLLMGIASLIGVFELVFWTLVDKPYTVHDHKSTPFYLMLMNGLINSIPHLYCACFGMRTFIDSKLRKGGLRLFVYALFSSIFTMMQVYFWWLPYFFGLIGPERKIRMRAKLEGVVSVLPPIEENIIPSLEHTILLPLSATALLLTISVILEHRTIVSRQIRQSRWNEVLLLFFCVAGCLLPFNLIIHSPDDSAAKVAAGGIIGLILFMEFVLYWPDMKEFHKKMDEMENISDKKREQIKQDVRQRIARARKQKK